MTRKEELYHMGGAAFLFLNALEYDDLEKNNDTTQK